MTTYSNTPSNQVGSFFIRWPPPTSYTLLLPVCIQGKSIHGCQFEKPVVLSCKSIEYEPSISSTDPTEPSKIPA